jgi:hypothetical protein
MGKSNGWTEAELDFAREHYPTKGSAYVAEHLHKSRGAVVHMMFVIGVKVENRAPHFTSEEESFIQEQAEKGRSERAIAKKINRNPISVRGYMQRNRLGRYADCQPPQSCFSCPHSDCIRVSQAPTREETEYLNIGLAKVGEGTVVRRRV